MMEMRKRKYQYFAAFAVSVASMTLAVMSAWPTPVLPKIKNNETDITINDVEISVMLAMSSPGFMVGSITTGFICDKFGRRATILGSAIPITLGTLIVLFAKYPWQLYITRLCWGVGTGMVGAVVSIYMTEIAEKDIRGSLTMYTRVMFNFGMLLVLSTGSFIPYQVLNLIILVLPTLYFALCWWIPETPYYSLKVGKVERARKNLYQLRGAQDIMAIENELGSMKMNVQNDMKHSSSLKELFTGKQYRKAIIITVGLKSSQMMTGGMTIQQYLGTIMNESKANISLSTVLITFGFVRFGVGLMSTVLIERVGRRPLLIWSFFGAGVSLGIVGMYFFLQEVLRLDEAVLSPYGLVPFIGILSSIILSSIGYNSLVYVIPAELFPMNVKAKALTCNCIFASILSFVVGIGYQFVKDKTGLYCVFWIFCLVALSGALFVYLVVPETRGKSFQEIQVLLNGEGFDESVELRKLNDVTSLELDVITDEKTKALNGA